MNTSSIGRKLLFGMNVMTALNGLLADWNRTHLFNRNWPPHAKFHDAMGINLGLILGGLGLYALQRNGGNERENQRLAALAPAVFFTAMIGARAYPGAESIETEFPDYWPKIAGHSYNEVPFALTMLLLTAAGWWMTESGDRQARASRRPADGLPGYTRRAAVPAVRPKQPALVGP